MPVASPRYKRDNQGLLGRGGLAEATPNEFGSLAKGTGVGLLTVAPDLLGMLFSAGNAIRAKSDPESVQRGVTPFPSGFSGDPIRQAAGTDNAAGLLGEFANPATPAIKGMSLLGDVARHAPEIGTGLKGLLAQSLFHGTPHKFDKFDLSKIGTGEGAQAYGHGLYFAENPGVAKSYQSNLARLRFEVDGTQIPDNVADKFMSELSAAATGGLDNHVSALSRERGEILGQLKQPIGDSVRLDRIRIGEIDEKLRYADELKKAKVTKGDVGHLYDVDIPDKTIANMLDWDAPLSEQPESVRNGFNNVLDSMIEHTAKQDAIKHDWPWIPEAAIPRARKELLLGRNVDEMTGREALETLYNRTASREAASKALNEAGIPGIRFYDGNSRISGTPFKQVKKSFLSELPQDAEFDEVIELVGTGHFTKEQDAVIKALEADDWLGFDYPSQAINAAYQDVNKGNFDMTPELVKAINNTVAPDATRNIVVFNPDDITSVKRDGELVFENKLGIGKPPVADNALADTKGGLLGASFEGLDISPSTENLKDQVGGFHELLPGVRSVKFSDVDIADSVLMGNKSLASDILKSNKIEPLLVVQGANGDLRVSEGLHRAKALQELGYTSFPARIATPNKGNK